jgi:hypothetical protein
VQDSRIAATAAITDINGGAVLFVVQCSAYLEFNVAHSSLGHQSVALAQLVCTSAA